MKVEITEKGVFGTKGERVDVGTVIEVRSDSLPGSLVGKCRILSGGKTAVINPAKSAPSEEEKAEAEAKRQALLKDAEELGLKPHPNTGIEKLQAAIDAKLAEAGEGDQE